jgi:SPOR domain
MTDEQKKDENLGSFYMGRTRPPPEPERKMPRGLLTIVAVLAFAAVVWYAYPQGQEKYEGADVPVITADAEAYKTSPDDPGGMEVRHQDSTVFDTVGGNKTASVETLMPKQEEPLDKTKLGLDTQKAQLNLAPQMKDIQKSAEQIEPAAAGTDITDITTRAEDKPEVVIPSETAMPEQAEAKPEEKAEEKTTAAAETKSAPKKAGEVYIQLGSYRNAAGAQQDWAKLQKKHPALLKGLSLHTEKIDLGAKGTFHRLQAGTLTESKAKDVCAKLKIANAGGCVVVK